MATSDWNNLPYTVYVGEKVIALGPLNNQWDLFQRHVVRLDPILARAGSNGCPIDDDERENLRVKLEAEKERLIKEAQVSIPFDLLPRKRYKKDPVDRDRPWQARYFGEGADGDDPLTWPVKQDGRTFQPVTVNGKAKFCTACGQRDVKKSDHFKGGKKNPCKVAGGDIEVRAALVIEWDEILPFNPGSDEQMKNYIRFFKHPMGIDRKTRRESANSKHLEELHKRFGRPHVCPRTRKRREGHVLYGLAMKLNKVTKTLGTYINGFAPDSKGLIYTTYTNAPSTWRLSSRNVNFQNVGKREGNQWAKEARKIVVAAPGHVFVAADSSAIEAVITGRLMGDQGFERLASIGIHSYLAGKKMGEKLDPMTFTPEDATRIKKANKKLYDQMKVTVYGTLYGMGPRLMFMENRETFPTMAAAEETQQFIFREVPLLRDWQDGIRLRAHKEKYIKQVGWPYRHHYYNVLQSDGSLGDDSKRSVAFGPQNAAAAFMRDNAIIIGEHPIFGGYLPANFLVHDGYTLHVPEHLQEDAIEFLIAVLTRPIPELGGLRVGCEVEVGRNWADYDAQSNPLGMKTVRKVSVV
jgi:hypothetical protein